MRSIREGYIPFKGYKTYFKIAGKPKKGILPLLVLHGGPGSAHNYLLSLAELAERGRQIIFYDQLGCGESDEPDDASLWTIQTFVDEINVLRNELALEKIHLLGHSWGGMLAIDYLLTKPAGIQSAVLASAMISMPLYNREVEKLKQSLGSHVYEALTRHEKAGTTDSSQYVWAYGEYKKQHLYRGSELPEEYQRPYGTKGDAVYHKMWGVSEAHAYGTMKNWDRIDRLHEITIPALITSGQYDELTPWQAGVTRDEIPDAKLRIFTNASHLAHIEVKDDYNAVVNDFLKSVEERQRG